MLTIRPMDEENVAQVAAIEAVCFAEETWSERLFRDELVDKTKHYYVAYWMDTVVGFAGYAQILDEGHIMNIAVAKTYRNKGIGTALVSEMIASGKENGITSFTLEVRESNVKARALYERMGFSFAGVRKNYYGGKENACIYWRYE